MRRSSLLCVLSGWALVVTTGCGGSLPADRANTTHGLAAHEGTLHHRVLLTGEIHPVEALQVRVPETPQWRVKIQWLVADGTPVKAGDTLVEFDNTAFASNLEEQRLAVLRASQTLERQLAKNRETLLEAEIEVERRRVALAKAELDVGVPASIVSRRELEERRLALERARSEDAKATASLHAARTAAAADEQVAQINLAKARRAVETAETAIAALVMRAPRDGIAVVGEHPREGRKLQVGDTVWVSLPVLSLPDLSRVEVQAGLSDVDDGLVAVGMAARCTLDAYPDVEYPGRVTAIGPVAQEAAGSSLRRAFPVTIALDHGDPQRMVPGMSVKVVVDAGAERGVLLASRAALDLASRPPRARLAGGGWREVAVGPCNALECVITGGLTDGDLLAPAGGFLP